MEDVLETMAEMEVELRPFESLVLTVERGGESAYTRPLPKYELPKVKEKPEPECVLEDDFRGFPKL
ncbi:MAG: hypothetical protein KJ955_02345 [Nanoarchaeota archaeon]|nr:hypothetical protein [Nanoarchaeota archaeon]